LCSNNRLFKARITSLDLLGLAETNGLDDFGQLLYERKGTEKQWTKDVFQFMAESPGRYITLKLKIGTGARIHLDNFVLECPPNYCDTSLPIRRK